MFGRRRSRPTVSLEDAEFEVQPHLRKKDGMIQEKLTDRLDWRVIGWKALEIAALLEAVKSGRIIVFEGKSTTDALRPLQTRKRVDADVDSLVADLSQGRDPQST